MWSFRPREFVFLVCIFLIEAPRFAEFIAIDNQVIGSEVQCSADTITVNFETQNEFAGRIFVKGNVDDPNCVRDYDSGGGITTSPSITFQMGVCNMQRSRMLSPQPGMMQSIVVIISFHPLFITKVDRAYKVQCFYMEAQKSVSNALEVSMLTTEDLRDTGRMPICTYTVRQGSRNGPVVRFAQIGDEVYHEWECDSSDHEMLIKNCYVNDGQNNRYEIIDERGCALDAVIMPDITYETQGQTKAWVEAHVFKFADRTSVFFQCTIQLCSAADRQCALITPPNCQSRRRIRTRRGALILANQGPSTISLRSLSLNEMDLLTDPIAVIDIQEGTTDDYDERFRQPIIRPYNGSSLADSETEMCFSTTGFALMISMVLAVFAVSAVVSAMLCMGKLQRDREFKNP